MPSNNMFNSSVIHLIKYIVVTQIIHDKIIHLDGLLGMSVYDDDDDDD